MLLFREGSALRVLAGMCLVFVRNLLLMLSEPVLRCDPHSFQPGIRATFTGNLTFQLPQLTFHSLLFLFSLHSSERPKSIHRSAGTVSKNLLGTFRYMVVVLIRFSRIPGPASLTCLLLPTDLWSDPTWRSPTRGSSGAEPSDRRAGGPPGPPGLSGVQTSCIHGGRAQRLFPTLETWKTEELERKWNWEPILDFVGLATVSRRIGYRGNGSAASRSAG